MYGFVVDGKEGFDSRDIHRVQTDTEYVAKFVRQVGGDENKAYNMLVCCLSVCLYVCVCVCVAMYICIFTMHCTGRSNEMEEVIWS